jgi:hypothetical protein
MLRDSETNERIPLKFPGKTIIGRAKVCDIIPNSTSISKKHAQIEVLVDSSTNTMKEIWIEDLGSRNGTFTGTPDSWKIINEKRRRIKVGDFIKFGLSVTYYRMERLKDEFAAEPPRRSGSASLVDSQLQGQGQEQQPQPQSLAVKQHDPPPEEYEESDFMNPPSFQDENNLLYSNIDDHDNIMMYNRQSPPPTQPQRPPSGSQSVLNNRNRDSTSSPSVLPPLDNTIHVSIEYPEGLAHRKPPVSILIGGDDEGEGAAGRRAADLRGTEPEPEPGSSAFTWNDAQTGGTG